MCDSTDRKDRKALSSKFLDKGGFYTSCPPKPTLYKETEAQRARVGTSRGVKHKVSLQYIAEIHRPRRFLLVLVFLPPPSFRSRTLN